VCQEANGDQKIEWSGGSCCLVDQGSPTAGEETLSRAARCGGCEDSVLGLLVHRDDAPVRTRVSLPLLSHAAPPDVQAHCAASLDLLSAYATGAAQQQSVLSSLRTVRLRC